MGVDYSGHYGIGVCIDAEKFDNTDNEFDHISEALDKKLDGDKYEWFEVGEGAYTGDTNDFYVSLKNPFKDGLDLTPKRDALFSHLKDIGIHPKSDFGEVGGLECY